VLGRAWWDKDGLDVRLITDPDERQPNRDTALRFAERGKIKTLRGVHAKLYIVDKGVLMTSANLTSAGFSRRHEAGLILKGEAAQSAILLFEKWWDMAIDLSKERVLRLPRRGLLTTGEDARLGLPEPTELPADPGDFGGEVFLGTFGDYPEFLDCYGQLVQAYTSLPRVWPGLPIYLETDAFLDYLYHHDGKPSQKFKAKRRQLSAKQQEAEIRKYALTFQSWATGRKDDKRWRLSNANAIHHILSPANIDHLDRAKIREVAGRLNCMGDNRVLNRFLKHPRNTTKNVREAWRGLLYGHHKTLPTDEMAACASSLFGFKRSSVQELLGWYWPAKFPLRNLNVDSGLRFLGYDVGPI
jgi:PLD-like domain